MSIPDGVGSLLFMVGRRLGSTLGLAATCWVTSNPGWLYYENRVAYLVSFRDFRLRLVIADCYETVYFQVLLTKESDHVWESDFWAMFFFPVRKLGN